MTPFLQQLDPRGERLRAIGFVWAERLFMSVEGVTDKRYAERTIAAAASEVAKFVKERDGSQEDAREAWRITWSHFDERFNEIMGKMTDVGTA